MPQQQSPHSWPHDKATLSGADSRLLKLLAITIWLQKTDSVLPLKRADQTYDIEAVALNGTALITDNHELVLSESEIEQLAALIKMTLAIRRLPDRRLLMVMPLLWSYANLGVSPMPPLENVGLFDDSWQFPSAEAALEAWRTWNPETVAEPDGWDRHVPSGRRRPGGDASREYVKDE